MGKRKLVFFLVMLFSFTSIVFALEDYKKYTLQEFIQHLEYNAQQGENNTYEIKIDNNNSITVTYDEAKNSIIQVGTFDGSTTEEKIGNSWLVKQVLSLSGDYESNKDSVFNNYNISLVNWGSEGNYCNLEQTGICYDVVTDKESIEIELSNKAARYILSTSNVGGNNEGSGSGNLEPDPIETGGQKASVDPEADSNPETGAFTQYSVIVILIISVVLMIKYMKKNEIKYKI